MPDIDFQQLSTVQNNLQPGAKTVAGTAVLTPTTLITKIVGGIPVVTITPPVSGDHLLFLVSDTAHVIGTTGNILVGYTMVVNRPIGFLYDSKQGKYYVLAVV